MTKRDKAMNDLIADILKYVHGKVEHFKPGTRDEFWIRFSSVLLDACIRTGKAKLVQQDGKMYLAFKGSCDNEENTVH